MKIALLLILSQASFIVGDDSSDLLKDELSLSPEDYKFWDRVLQGDLSVPIAPTIPVPAPVAPVPVPVAPVPVPVAPVPVPVAPVPVPVAPVPVPLPIAPVPVPVPLPVAPVPVPVPITAPATGPVPCDIDVSIDCVTSTGLPCNEIQPPNPVCSAGSDIAAVAFGYTGNACSDTGNSQGPESFCEDLGTIDTSVEAVVLCRDALVPTSGLVVEPPTVPRGGVFVVSAPSGNLPAKIDCLLVGPGETQLQQVVVDTSGDISLNLRDEFGAFTLLSCGDDEVLGGMQSCLEALTYTIDVNNVGPVALEVTTAELIFDGETTSFLSEIGTNIVPGESATVATTQTIDLCVAAEVCATVNVVATPPNGDQCLDTDEYCFQITPLPPSPVPPAPVPVPVAPVPVPVAPVPVPLPVAPAPVPVPVAPVPVPYPAPVPVPYPAPVPVPYPDAPAVAPSPIVPTVPVSIPKSKTSMSGSMSGPSPGVIGAPSSSMSGSMSGPSPGVIDAPSSSMSGSPSGSMSGSPSSGSMSGSPSGSMSGSSSSSMS